MYRITVDGALFCASNIDGLAIIDPVVTLEVNKAGTFTFTIPPQHPKYNAINERTSIIEVYRDNDAEPLFAGVAVEQTVDFYKQKKVSCEGEFTFFNDSTLRPKAYSGKTVTQLLTAYVAEHNSHTENFKHFTVGQVTVTDPNNSISCFTNYEVTMSQLNEDLVKDLGGFFRIRHSNGVRYLDYLAESPHTASQVVRLGMNIMNLSKNFDTTDIATVVIPLGAALETQSIEGLDERLTIKAAPADGYHPSGADYVQSSTAIMNFGRIETVVTWDDVTTDTALLAKAEAYLTDVQFEKMVLQVQAVDLGLTTTQFEKFRLLDQVRVVSAPHNLDRYFLLSKMVVNLNNPEKDTITLGVEQSLSLSAKSVSASNEVKTELKQQTSVLKGAINHATALITGAEGGYVVLTQNSDGQPIELKIQDALENPTKLWRWNINGLGYSSDGGQTYGLAMTMDGRIVADFITAGTMLANRIKGGTLEVGGSGLAADGTITIKDANNLTVLTISKYGITLYDAQGNGKAWLDHTGLTMTGGTINASAINGATVSGVSISSSCTIQTDKFSVNSNGEVYFWGKGYSDSELNGSRCVGRLGLISYGDLYVSGSKDRIVETKDFGYQLLNAYETPTPYFGDVGEGVTDEHGSCIIGIDEVFAQCVDDICSYQVFVSKYGPGDLYVSERHPDHFVVTGEPGVRFAWEMKAVQKDFNGVRFQKVDPEIIEIMERGKE